MAVADIYNRVRMILYGQGLGERPALVQVDETPNGSIDDPFAQFDLVTGDGAKVGAGDVLSVYASEAEHHHVLYVTDVSTDTVTVVNGYLGSTPLADADDLDTDHSEALLEVNPFATLFEIEEAVDTIVARYLWPDIWQIETITVSSPDIVDGQEAVPANVEEIIAAWQVIGPDNVPIAAQRHPVAVNTSQKSTGNMAMFDWYDGSTGYYTAKTKITEADEATEELTRLIATGAAALTLGGHLVEATIERTKKDNIEAISQRNAVGGLLWRDFLTLKQEYARELGRRHESRIVIDRG